jgi:hypothetical protein
MQAQTILGFAAGNCPEDTDATLDSVAGCDSFQGLQCNILQKTNMIFKTA